VNDLVKTYSASRTKWYLKYTNLKIGILILVFRCRVPFRLFGIYRAMLIDCKYICDHFVIFVVIYFGYDECFDFRKA
jgi:hypothetical protein